MKTLIISFIMIFSSLSTSTNLDDTIFGLWKSSYSPELKDLLEPDSGYAIFYPGGLYISVHNNDLSKGSFKLDKKLVYITINETYTRNTKGIFINEEMDEPYQFSMKYLGVQEVVTFDDLKKKVKRPVLMFNAPDATLNYSLAKDTTIYLD